MTHPAHDPVTHRANVDAVLERLRAALPADVTPQVAMDAAMSLYLVITAAHPRWSHEHIVLASACRGQQGAAAH